MNKLMIKKIGVLSIAKIQAAIMGVLSLIIAIPYGLFVILISILGFAGSRGDAGMAIGGFGIVGGIAIMIILPIVYTIIGFIAGAISALVYNVVAGAVGGVEIEVETLY